MTLMKTVGLVITITAVRVEVGAALEIFEDLLEALQPQVASEVEVLTQIPSAAAKLRRDPREPIVEDNPALTGKIDYDYTVLLE